MVISKRKHGVILAIIGVVVGMACLWAGAAEADQAGIASVFSTGVSSDKNVLLSATSVDPHYTLTTSADPSFPGPNAFVGATPPATYIGVDCCSQWITPTTDFNSPCCAVGTYIYTTTFDLTGFDPSTAVIGGQWSTDNNGLDILINGSSTGFTTSFTQFQAGFAPFDISTGFVAGLNTLAFEVSNGGGPTALRVELSGQANTLSVPEPSSLLLLGSGLAGLAAWRWKHAA